MSKLNLNLGCGDDLRKGFLNIDIEPNHTKPSDENSVVILSPGDEYLSSELDSQTYFLQGDITELDQLVGFGTADHIKALYVVEHIPVDKLYSMFWSWNRALKMGGTIEIVVPDFEALIEYYQRDKSLTTFRVMVYELVSSLESTPHTACWTPEWLEHFLQAEGFDVVKVDRKVGARDLGFRVEAVKVSTTSGKEMP